MSTEYFMHNVGSSRRSAVLLSFAIGFLLLVCPLASADFMREGEPGLEGKAITESNSFPHFAELVRELSPAVVNISVEAKNEDEGQEQIFPFLKKDPTQPSRSLGSGFIVSEDGYIITNNHVIDKSDKIVIRLLDDKAEYVADLIGHDQKTDLALLKIKTPEKLKTVYIGDSDQVEVGEWVLAIGNQFQLGQTVTAGIVSAKSRRVPTKVSGPYDAFIQTDASINPGSSGGPLFNTHGQVIGINTAIFSPGRGQFGGTGFNIGIGFAIPINLVKSVITQLKEHGKVTRGLLGVIIQRIDSDIASILNLPAPDGALVADIMPGSPASRAGFQRKDVIVSFEGHTIRDHEDLPLLVANTPIGSEVTIEVLRNGQKKTLSAKIEELRDLPKADEAEKPKSNTIGLVVQDVTEDIAKALKLPASVGVVVNSVESGSVAERGGIQRGDIIEEMAGQPIKDSDHFEKIVEGLPIEKPVLVLVRKPEGTRFLTLKLPKPPKS